MGEKSIVVMGLPGSGKTTFLAALWHLISGREIDLKLKFVTLRAGNAKHLNDIASRWRQAKAQERTSVAGDRIVSMTLMSDGEEPDVISFPDVAGEGFRQMWEERDCEESIAESLKSDGVMFFIHADKINSPGWIVDEAEQCKELGIQYEPGQMVPWSPRLAPTQVQVVDLLQLLQLPPLDVGPRRLVIVMSAWDKVEAERLSPKAYLARKLPLLAQYLDNGLHNQWQGRVYGISAQGGDYDQDKVPGKDAERMRAVDMPSMRISVVFDESRSHDLTEPLYWLRG